MNVKTTKMNNKRKTLIYNRIDRLFETIFEKSKY